MERKGDHQKLKMLYLVKIFLEETDDEHALSMLNIPRAEPTLTAVGPR